MFDQSFFSFWGSGTQISGENLFPHPKFMIIFLKKNTRLKGMFFVFWIIISKRSFKNIYSKVLRVLRKQDRGYTGQDRGSPAPGSLNKKREKRQNWWEMVSWCGSAMNETFAHYWCTSLKPALKLNKDKNENIFNLLLIMVY